MKDTQNHPRTPLALRPGSRVRIVAPAGPVPVEPLWTGVGLLESVFGFDVDIHPQVFEKERYFAGNDDLRKNTFIDTLLDPSIDGIFCARGGYGTIRIVGAIFDVLTKCNRIPALVGFSDITTFHAAFVRSGHVSFHGPVVTQLERLTEETLEQVRTMLAGDSSARHLGGPWMRCLRPGKTSGPIFSGNLSILASLIGTQMECSLPDTLVVIEDVGEPAYRVDRMIQQLLRNGLDRAAAIIIGEFSQIDAQQTAWLESLWQELATSVSCPVVRNAPVGHESRNIAIPQGVRAIIDTETSVLDLTEPWVLPDA